MSPTEGQMDGWTDMRTDNAIAVYPPSNLRIPHRTTIVLFTGESAVIVHVTNTPCYSFYLEIELSGCL